MKRGKRRDFRRIPSRAEFVLFVHSQLTASDMFYPVDQKAKLIDGELVRFTEMRFIESPPIEAPKGGRNG